MNLFVNLTFDLLNFFSAARTIGVRRSIRDQHATAALFNGSVRIYRHCSYDGGVELRGQLTVS